MVPSYVRNYKMMRPLHYMQAEKADLLRKAFKISLVTFYPHLHDGKISFIHSYIFFYSVFTAKSP